MTCYNADASVNSISDDWNTFFRDYLSRIAPILGTEVKVDCGNATETDDKVRMLQLSVDGLMKEVERLHSFCCSHEVSHRSFIV